MERLTKFDILDLDELRVQVLVENSVQMGPPGLRAAHGLSMLVQSRYENEWASVLFDVGSDPDILFGNMAVLGIDPSIINCIVLSHDHGDHTGGLPKVIQRIGKSRLPVVTHPASGRTIFGNRPHIYGGRVKDVDAERIEEAGGSLLPASEPLEIAPGLFTSGYIERTTKEPTGLDRKVLEPDGTWHEDEVADDLSLVAKVKGQGLVVLTGCAHAGVVNILRHCRKIAGQDRVSALAGGFHLVTAKDDRIAWTIEEFKAAGLDFIASGHCTGFDAEASLRQAFGRKYRHICAGAKICFPQ